MRSATLAGLTLSGLLTATLAPAVAETSGLRKQYLLDNVLRRHVRDGQVNYAALKDDADLDKYIAAMADVPLDALRSDNSRMAFWINVYNGCVLKAIAEKWPVARVQNVPGMFDQARWRIGGKAYSLNQILDDVLRPFGDPRIHFALCTGARGGPPLRSRSYTAYDLGKQLDDAARQYLQTEGIVKINHVTDHITVPEFFRWHADDFRPRGVGAFIGPYMSSKRDQVYVAARRVTIEYSAFDWRVNAVSPETAAEEAKGETGAKPKGKAQGKARGKVWSAKEGKWK